MGTKTHTENVKLSAETILNKIGSLNPKIAIILGSGLANMTEHMKETVTIPYSELPGFPELNVKGHVGEAVVGKLNNVDVIVFKGRQHFYETNDAYPLKTLIRTIKEIGTEILFITNSAGSLREDIKVSELMVITDHINYMGFNPLIGTNDDDFGTRFPPLNDAWDPELNKKLKETALENNIPLHEGVYIAFRGPSFETPAEIRMAQGFGADAVGMSSVPDCIIARHCGLKVIGCSCITNMGAGLSDEVLSHEKTLANAKRGLANFEKLILEFIGKI